MLHEADGAAAELTGSEPLLGNYDDIPAVEEGGTLVLRPFEAVVLAQR